MSVRKSFDDQLNDWLDEGPEVAPHDLLYAVLDGVSSVRQERRSLFVGPWRIPMSMFARLGVAAIAVAVVVAAFIATRPGPLVGTNPTATPTPSTLLSPSTYTSKFYAYSITVPLGWRALSAAARWDGTGAPDMEDSVIDTLVSPGSAAMLAAAAPTSKDLATYTADSIAADFAVHRSTCPGAEHPALIEAITVGGEPAKLVSMDCGILINVAYTVRAGQGYRFTFRDTAVHAATDPTDKATFLALLASVVFK